MPEIAEVTGHSLMDVACILDRHYLGERTALADAAIRKLEKSERRTKTSNRFSNRSKRNCQDNQDNRTRAKYLKSLVGAQGLERWTR